MRRLARALVAAGLVVGALLAGFIGGGNVLTAVTGEGQDSPGWVLVIVGAAFLLSGAGLALLALAVLGAAAGLARGALAVLVPLVCVPWWEALGPAGVLINAALLLAAVFVGRRLVGRG